MKLSEAFSRYKFQVTSGNKPNEKDVEAFNTIAAYFQSVQEKTIQENRLFAKLYTYMLGKFTPHYNDVDAANAHLNKVLQQPMNALLQTLELELRAMEIRQVIPDPILSELSPKATKEKLEQYPNLATQFMEAWDFWDLENVQSHIETQVNLSIQKFKNYD